MYDSGVYSTLIFNIYMQRKSIFFVFNLLLPCILISILSVVVFLLPPESGERINFSEFSCKPLSNISLHHITRGDTPLIGNSCNLNAVVKVGMMTLGPVMQFTKFLGIHLQFMKSRELGPGPLTSTTVDIYYATSLCTHSTVLDLSGLRLGV